MWVGTPQQGSDPACLFDQAVPQVLSTTRGHRCQYSFGNCRQSWMILHPKCDHSLDPAEVAVTLNAVKDRLADFQGLSFGLRFQRSDDLRCGPIAMSGD